MKEQQINDKLAELNQIEPNFYECEICNEPITNPICYKCLLQEVFIWSSIYPDLSKKLIPIIKNHLKNMKTEKIVGIECIKCKKNEMSICTYCFIREVFLILESINANKTIKKEFLQFFNWDLGHKRYVQYK